MALFYWRLRPKRTLLHSVDLTTLFRLFACLLAWLFSKPSRNENAKQKQVSEEEGRAEGVPEVPQQTITQDQRPERRRRGRRDGGRRLLEQSTSTTTTGRSGRRWRGARIFAYQWGRRGRQRSAKGEGELGPGEESGRGEAKAGEGCEERAGVRREGGEAQSEHRSTGGRSVRVDPAARFWVFV